MADNFEQFLSEVAPIIPVAEEDDEEQFKDYTGYSIDNEDESVLRFKSMVNSPPSLLSLSLLRVCSILNEKSCEPKNAEYVRTFWDERVKSLPEDIQAKIKSQCSFSTLKCLYQDEVWQIEDVSLLIGSIKQEEDMLRYLYWKDPNNPLLRIYEEHLIIKPLQDPLFAKVSEPLNAMYKYESTNVFDDPLIQAKNKWLQKVQVKGKEVAVELEYNDEQKAIDSFKEWSKNIFEGMNWNNVLVVGGSILSSFRYSNTKGVNLRKSFRQNPDIDIYIYGLSTEDAQKKVLEIFNLVQSKTTEALGIWRSNNTITIISSQYRKAYSEFINIQIILSSYTSALEVLLSSDFNTCSVAYNGKEIIAIPRFVVGMMYETNFLDSSIKFGPKLRWERIEKYYKKGFDFSAPLHMRVHGLGPFTTHEEFKRGQALHPNTVQMVELMCLLKPHILGCAYSTPTTETGQTFGLEREGEFRNWHLTWMKGIWCDRQVRQFPVSGILHDRDNEKHCKSDYLMLKEKLKDIPPWVTQYYKKQQVLLMPHTGIREPPHYLTYIFQQFDVSNGDEHFDPERHKDIEAYINTHCKFTPYNESAYQCFHLNYLVDKEFNSAINPYVQSNTSLIELVHSTQTEWFTLGNFEEYLSGDIPSLEKSFKLHGKNWKLTLQYASPEISFLILKKERDDEKEMQDPFYCPKMFVNFTITCSNGEDIYWEWSPRKKYRHSCDYIMDGSQVFTNEEPHNTWMTWITNDYFTPKEGSIKYVTTPKLIYDNETTWVVNMQRITPKFDTVAM